MDLKKVPILPIDKEIEAHIPKEYFENTDVLEIPDFPVHLKIWKDANQEDYLNLDADGTMILPDAKTLEPVSFPFQIRIEEKIDLENEMFARFITNFQNTLDIIGVLWENIVLEIPISFSTHELQEEIHEGWEVVGEKKEKIDPRLAPLLELLDKEKE